MRHGERAPQDTYPNDPYIKNTMEPYGWGQLTNVSIFYFIYFHRITLDYKQKNNSTVFFSQQFKKINVKIVRICICF